MTGEIKRLVSDKRFGFIRDNTTGVEYFFHFSAVKNAKPESLHEGQEVSFENTESTKGPRAEDVFIVTP